MSKKFLYIILLTFACGLMAQENKLDELDKQSEDFFNAITGLEKTYLQEQIKKRKDSAESSLDTNGSTNSQRVNIISKEQLERNLLENENTKAKLGTDITKSKNIKDILIKSMYSFNGKNYVVLTQDDNQTNTNTTTDDVIESTLNIEGRYKKGDKILNHTILDINTRTKTVVLYKEIDEEYGYIIYLNNEALTVSDLKRIEKDKNKKEKVKLVSVVSDVANCIYELKIPMLNVRSNKELDGEILKILQKDDKIVGTKYNNLLLIDTIYRTSGKEVKAKGAKWWVSLSSERFNANKENCF